MKKYILKTTEIDRELLYLYEHKERVNDYITNFQSKIFFDVSFVIMFVLKYYCCNYDFEIIFNKKKYIVKSGLIEENEYIYNKYVLDIITLDQYDKLFQKKYNEYVI